MTETVMYVSAAVDAHFDEQTHTWTVGEHTARVLISTDGTLPASAPASAGALDPYLGVAVHGIPNYFLLTGPDTAAQKSYIAKCLQHLSRTDGSRIEVRAGTQRMFNDRRRRPGHRNGRYWRAVGAKIPSAFEVQSPIEGDDEVYDGPATVTVDGRDHAARVRLAGRMEPIDGRYHWRGTLFIGLPDVKLPHDVDVAVGDGRARGRLTERTPQGGYSMTGTGPPPFALTATTVDVPLL